MVVYGLLHIDGFTTRYRLFEQVGGSTPRCASYRTHSEIRYEVSVQIQGDEFGAGPTGSTMAYHDAHKLWAVRIRPPNSE